MPLLPSQPRRARLRQRLAPFVVLSAMALGAFAMLAPPAIEAAWMPPAPASGYTPRHVQQLKNNCVWAAGQMLIDKWTHGRVRVSQSELRHASRTKQNAATLADLARGVGRATGLLLHSSPGMGDPMTWWQFLDRLEHGGGGVVIGLYSRLPTAFSRWNPAFAASPRSGHALYVERYQRAEGRVWLMDPLAPQEFPGEWIPVEALRRFATFHGEFVLAAATPARHRPTTAPLTDQAYHLGSPGLAGPAIAGSTVGVRVGLRIDDDFPLPAAHRLVGRWDPILPPTSDPPLAGRLPIDSGDAEPAAASTPAAVTTVSSAERPSKRGFAAALPVPAIPGAYRLTIGLREPGKKNLARMLAPIQVEVLPPFAASLSVPRSLQLAAGQGFTLKLGVRNLGTLDWRRAPDVDVPPEPNRGPLTAVVLTWHSADGDERPAANLPAELAPGATATFSLSLVAPREPGDWSIAVDVVSVEYGALSSNGSGSQGVPVAVAASLSGSGLVPRR
jgi:hypothetical protein